MAAPILRYSDPRLYGHLLTQPNDTIYRTCLKNFSNPVHPRNYWIAEYALRVLKAAAGLIALSLLSPITLVGRLSQIAHYHCLSEEKIMTPEPMSVNGIYLPELKTSKLTSFYHGTSHDAAVSICRDGFTLSKGGAMGPAIYVATHLGSAKSYAQAGGVFVLNLDVDEKEIAWLNRPFTNPYGVNWISEAEQQYNKYCNIFNKKPSNVEFFSSIQELFLKNGYRAVGYLVDGGESFPAIAVYDPSVVNIQEFNPREGVSVHLSQSDLFEKKATSW